MCFGSLPNAVRKGCKVSEVRIDPAVVTEHSVVLISPGPALTPGLVLDISILLLRGIWNVVLVNCRYPAESLTLLIVGDRSEDIQHGGVSPALVNLENKEIWSEDITMSLILCNKRKCWSSSLPSPERRIGNLAMKKYWIIWTIM